MSLKIFSIVAGFMLAGPVFAQPVSLPPLPSSPPSIGMRLIFLNDLAFGMEGGEVFQLQYVLQTKGYLPLEHVLTSYFGPKTWSAVVAYQRAQNISATGFVGPLTRTALNGETSGVIQETTIVVNMGMGSSGGQVRALQNKLLALGYFSGEATGYFGPKTRAAVVAYQQAYGIPATGYVGPLTRAALNAPIVPQEEQVTMREGQQEDSFLLEKIYSGSVTGKNFPAYPVPREEGDPVSLRVGETVSNGCTIMLTLTGIQGTTATFIKKIDFTKQCPICLSSKTFIYTPNGLVPVTDMKKGMLVWTNDEHGRRITVPIMETSKVFVSRAHTMVSLKLRDERSLMVSPGHPTADGRKIGDLLVGDMFDGSEVAHIERVPYSDRFTYDILPAGATGTYWADGILVGSTLKLEKP